jgi:predicted metal-dependent hydrolase
MKKKIQLHKRKIEYTLKVSNRARRMRLAIYCDGDFVVTAPYNLDQNLVEKYIIRKSQWILDKLDYFKNFRTTVLSPTKTNNYSHLKAQALQLAKDRIEYYNRTYNFKFNAVNIKNQKTRWGSCSKKGNLNFNYKIALLPQKLSNYIIVHELCHLGQFNHSQKFWNLVAKAMPDYLDIRKELRENKVNFF